MLDEAIDLARAGFSVIWLRERSKSPFESKWASNPTYTPAELKKSYIKGYNAGVRLGEPSKIGKYWLHAIDMDVKDPEWAERAIKQVKLVLESDLSEFPTVISGSGGDSRHFYFLTTEPFRSKKLWVSGEKIKGKDGKDHWTAEVELFGTGKQCALPPSIHPDTGKRYRWSEEFIPSDLPVVDADLLKAATGDDDYDPTDADHSPLGLRLGEAEEALEHLIEWADDHTTWRNVGMALKHEFGEDGWTLFDRWSRKGKGYNKGDNRAQWRAFKSERSKPITMRSVMQAANEAAHTISEDDLLDELGEVEEKEPKALPRKGLIREFGDPLPKKSGPKGSVRGVPPHLLSIPGRLGLAVEHYNDTSLQDQPQFAVQAALALGSVVLGRYWKTSADNFSTLYLVNLGATGSGKEFVRTFIAKILSQARVDSLMGPNQFASEAAVTAELVHNPRNVTVMDEFGKLLGSTKKSANTNSLDAQTALISLFGLLNGQFRPKRYSHNGKSEKQIQAEKNLKITRPALTMVGLATPETFYDSLGQENVADGFMNRLLIVNSRMKRQLTNIRPWKAAPPLLIKWIRQHVLPSELQGFLDRDDFVGEDETGNPLGEDTLRPHEPEIVPFSDACVARLREINQWVIDEQDRLEHQRLDGLLARSQELAMRISLIVALSCRSQEIELSHLNWAWDYVRFYTMEMIEQAKVLMGSNEITRTADHLATVIAESGSQGLSIRELGRISSSFQKMETRSAAEVIRLLKEHNDVVEVQPKRKGRGRPSIRFVHQDYIRED